MVNIEYITPRELPKEKKGEFFEDEVGRILSKMRFKIDPQIKSLIKLIFSLISWGVDSEFLVIVSFVPMSD